MIKLKFEEGGTFDDIKERETFTCEKHPGRVFLKRDLVSDHGGSYGDRYHAIVLIGSDPGNLFKDHAFTNWACKQVNLEARIVS